MSPPTVRADGSPLVAAPEASLLVAPTGSLTGEQVLHAAHRIADTLPDAPVVNLCRDRGRFIAVLLATILRGQHSPLLSDRSTDNLRRTMATLPDAVLVTDDGASLGELPHRTIPALDPAPHPGTTNPWIADDRHIVTVFTSGSTGVPAAHEKRWGALRRRSLAGADQFGLPVDATIVGMVPPQHMYGLETTVLIPLHCGRGTTTAEIFFPADLRSALAIAAAPRILVTTPLQIRNLLEAEIELPVMETVISATAPLETAFAARAEAAWDTTVHEIYGATEVGSIASRHTVADTLWTLYPDVTLLSAGEDRFEAVAPPAPSHAIADMLELADARRFRLLGRASDMLKRGGKRASLAGLTAALNGIPGVRDGVFFAPDADGAAHRVHVFAVAPARTADDLLAELRARIDPAFLPRRVILVDHLPRNSLGKITREALEALERAAASAPA